MYKDPGKMEVEMKGQNFPGGPVVKNLPANAGDLGSVTGPGRFTCRGATRPVGHNYFSPGTLCSAIRGATTMKSLPTTARDSPGSLKLEKACTSNEDPAQLKRYK